MDHSAHARLDIEQLTGADLEGATVYDPADEDVGRISHLHGFGADAQVVVEVGSILGFGGKNVIVPITALDVMEDEDGNVHAVTSWTKAEIEALPEHIDV